MIGTGDSHVAKTKTKGRTRTQAKTKKPLLEPVFRTDEEARQFWDTHSLADYWDQMKPVRVHRWTSQIRP